MKRRPKRTWQDALAAGNHQCAVFRFLIEWMGARPSRWMGSEADVAQHVLDAAAQFVTEHRECGPEWACASGRPVRMAIRFVEDWIAHRGHRQLGTPYDWREDRAKYFVGRERCQVMLRDLAEAKRTGAAMTNAFQAAERAFKETQARELRSRGMQTPDIARLMGVGESTVRRYLAGADSRRSPAT